MPGTSEVTRGFFIFQEVDGEGKVILREPFAFVILRSEATKNLLQLRVNSAAEESYQCIRQTSQRSTEILRFAQNDKTTLQNDKTTLQNDKTPLKGCRYINRTSSSHSKPVYVPTES